MSAKKRKRRRRAKPAAPAAAPRPSARAARPRHEAAERPPAPWGSFPLSELAIFVGAVLLVIGFFAATGPRQVTMVVAGFAIASVGALEVTLREHLAGYRSHTLLLAGVPAVITLGLLFYLGPDSLTPPVRLLIGVAVYALSAWALVGIFRARSGGRAYRLKAPRR